MNIAIYGGSFNPVHFGHVGLAKWVVEHTDIDEVWLLVSPNNPLKSPSELAPASERLAGVVKAIEGIPGLRASDFEFHLPVPSYTANTLRELSKAYPEHEFSLLIGEDNWQCFDKWREHDYILQNYRIFIYPRHSLHPSPFTPHQSSIINHQSSIHQSSIHQSSIINLNGAPYFDISSTEIRQRK